jgi:hypothetical protein
VLEQNAGMVCAANQQAGCPYASDDKAGTLHGPILGLKMELSKLCRFPPIVLKKSGLLRMGGDPEPLG